VAPQEPHFDARSQPARAASEIFVAVLFHHFRQAPDEAALIGLPQFLAVRLDHTGLIN
jgi:hypothetical protein